MATRVAWLQVNSSKTQLDRFKTALKLLEIRRIISCSNRFVCNRLENRFKKNMDDLSNVRVVPLTNSNFVKPFRLLYKQVFLNLHF